MEEKIMRELLNYIKDGNLKGSVDIGSDFRLYFLAQGEYNKNYVLEDSKNRYVLRLNMGSQIGISNQIEYEYRALKKLEVSGYTPKVYFLDGSRRRLDYGVLVMEYLEGKPLNYGKDLEKAAEIFSRIHSIEIRREDFDYLITENYIFSDRIKEAHNLLRKFWDAPKIGLETKKFFERYLSWCIDNAYMERHFIDNPWRAINNTEVNSHNFIIGAEKSYLIDWEKPVISDPCQDITQFLAPTTTLWKSDVRLDKEDTERFYSKYEKKFPEKNIRERVRRYTPYLYLRALSWCAFAYVEYQDPKREIRNEDTYRKIQSYLEVDFMRDLLREWLV